MRVHRPNVTSSPSARGRVEPGDHVFPVYLRSIGRTEIVKRHHSVWTEQKLSMLARCAGVTQRDRGVDVLAVIAASDRQSSGIDLQRACRLLGSRSGRVRVGIEGRVDFDDELPTRAGGRGCRGSRWCRRCGGERRRWRGARRLVHEVVAAYLAEARVDVRSRLAAHGTVPARSGHRTRWSRDRDRDAHHGGPAYRAIVDLLRCVPRRTARGHVAGPAVFLATRLVVRDSSWRSMVATLLTSRFNRTVPVATSTTSTTFDNR